MATKENIREWLALIPTKFKLTSACDKALLQEVAVRVVAKHTGEIVRFLRGEKE